MEETEPMTIEDGIRLVHTIKITQLGFQHHLIECREEMLEIPLPEMEGKEASDQKDFVVSITFIKESADSNAPSTHA